MLEFIYRIYQVATEEERERNREFNVSAGLFSSTSKNENHELLMDCIACDSREAFKDIIRVMYGKDIKFRYSKKLVPGDVYCVIIGEHCYNGERYFSRVTYKCDQCGCEVESVLDKAINFSDYELRHDLYNNSDFKDKKFCSVACKEAYRMQNSSSASDDNEFWVDRDMFHQPGVIGYIYKITKKSTGEFYIGQTKYVPVFRWGQHLKTERFNLENLLDYSFETVREVREGENVLQVEKDQIQLYSEKFPALCLNVIHNKGKASDYKEGMKLLASIGGRVLI